MRKSRISMTIRGEGIYLFSDSARQPFYILPVIPAGITCFTPYSPFCNLTVSSRLYHSATTVFSGLFPVVTGLVLSDAKFGSPA